MSVKKERKERKKGTPPSPSLRRGRLRTDTNKRENRKLELTADGPAVVPQPRRSRGTMASGLQIYADGGLGMLMVENRSSSRTELVMVKLSKRTRCQVGMG